ncbi:hypothetical protein OESDEN_03741 [Oesophagostomum dentatum]|uniref:RING-type domain-containing protein n=1 Tax=Oesophagostomum dentatum TaxID=61180 RepID=A0A0B1TKF4_OESDE|nr:hypothetical protein OESDEN_03741 [Oesophagostomum dentatum]
MQEIDKQIESLKFNVQIESDRKAIVEGEKRMQEIDKQIESLKFNVQVLQVNKCSACDTVLQLPAVHFLCRHSYHVHCFESYSEKPDVCPACAVPTSREEMKENMDGKAAYTKFHDELNKAPNGMDVISKYLRNGLFDPPRKKAHKKTTSAASAKKASSNPFEDDELNPFADSSTLSSSSSEPTVHRSSFTSAPHRQTYDDAKNPFVVGTNPFDE